MSELTSKDLKWFRLANSAPPHRFYEFKDRFLRRFGTPDGWDKQEIEMVCHSCDGTGHWIRSTGEECNRCGGTGIYDVRTHWLRRYDLCGQIFHKPEQVSTVWQENGHRYPEFKNLIEGRIQHAAVDSRVARRAFFRLLLRHEPQTFFQIVVERIKDGTYWFRVKLVWRLIRIRNRMDLFHAVPEDDGIPF